MTAKTNMALAWAQTAGWVEAASVPAKKPKDKAEA